MERKKEGCEDMKRLKDNDWKERKKDVRTWKDWKIMIEKKERKKDVRTGKDWKIMIGKKERSMWGHEKTER